MYGVLYGESTAVDLHSKKKSRSSSPIPMLLPSHHGPRWPGVRGHSRGGACPPSTAASEEAAVVWRGTAWRVSHVWSVHAAPWRVRGLSGRALVAMGSPRVSERRGRWSSRVPAAERRRAADVRRGTPVGRRRRTTRVHVTAVT